MPFRIDRIYGNLQDILDLDLLMIHGLYTVIKTL